MPQIRPFEATKEEVTLRPSEVGTRAMEEAASTVQRGAARIGELYHEAGQLEAQSWKNVGTAVNSVTQQFQQVQANAQAQQTAQDNSQASMDLTNLEYNFHNQLDNINNPYPDPNDPTGQKTIQPDPNNASTRVWGLLQKYQDGVNELASKQTNPKTQALVLKQGAAGYRAFATKAYAIHGQLTYQAAASNYIQGAQRRAGIVYNDPTQLDAQLGALKTDTETLAGNENIPAEKRGELQTATLQQSSRMLIENAFEGMAKTPQGRQQALDALNSGKYDEYVGEDKDKLVKYINTSAKTAITDQENQRKLIGQQQTDAADQRTDQYISDAMSPNPKMTLSQIWTDPAYKDRPDLRDKAMKVVETMRKSISGDVSVNPQVSSVTTRNLFGQITAPEADLRTTRANINDAFSKGALTRQDFNFLNTQLKNQEAPGAKQLTELTNKAMDDYAATIDPSRSLAGPSALGNQKLFEARRDLLQRQNDLRSKGQDPASALDPASQNFFFTPQNLSKYHTTLNEQQTFQKNLEQNNIQGLQHTLGLSGASVEVGGIAAPPQYQQAFADAGKKWGVPADLLAKQMYQESGFKDVRSAAGAEGYSQFMPGTAARYGVNPHDFNSSLNGQAHYMSDLMKQFNGNPGLALAGYNWGEKNVEHWLDRGANPAAVPTETRNYVQSITGRSLASWQQQLLSGLPHPATLAEAYKLGAGTRIVTPKGTIGIVPQPPSVPMSQ